MDVRSLLRRMERFPAALAALLADCPDADARWRPDSEAWSLLEIVCHLADEESEDFRQRLRSTLEDPTRPWPPIDPVGAIVDRRYNERELATGLERFAEERQRTLTWLRDLQEPPWHHTYRHPQLGTLSAGDLFASHAAHDALHLRQISRRLFELVVRDAGEGSTAYAGLWPQGG